MKMAYPKNEFFVKLADVVTFATNIIIQGKMQICKQLEKTMFYVTLFYQMW